MALLRPSFLAPLTRYLLFAFAVPALVLAVAGRLPRHAPAGTPPELVRQRMRAGLPVPQAEIDSLLQPWLAERGGDVEAHRAYVHLSMESRGGVPARRRGGEGDPLRDYYQAMAAESDAPGGRRDLAHYALGLYEAERDRMEPALAYYAAVTDDSLAYLHFSRGTALEELKRTAAADSEYRREIAGGRAIPAAVARLGALRLAERRWDDLRALRQDALTAPWIPPPVTRAEDLHRGRLLPWLGGWLQALALPFKPGLLLIALYTSLIWFLLIRWWDAFEKEPLTLSLFVVALGALTPAGVFAFHDLLAQFAHVEPGGGGLRDYGYFVVIVGLVEESLKIVPVFVVAALSGAELDEPVDWLVYGCLAALGFALLENYQYLVMQGLRVGTGRYFLSTPFHLSLTGTLALAVPGARRGGWGGKLVFLATLAAMALVHGTFDFLLTADSPLLKLAGLVLGPLWGLMFLRTLGHLAAQSPYRTNPQAFRVSCTSWFMGAYVLFLLLKYFIITRSVDPADADRNLIGDLIGGQVFFLIALVYTKVTINRDPRAPAVPPAGAPPTDVPTPA